MAADRVQHHIGILKAHLLALGTVHDYRAVGTDIPPIRAELRAPMALPQPRNDDLRGLKGALHVPISFCCKVVLPQFEEYFASIIVRPWSVGPAACRLATHASWFFSAASRPRFVMESRIPRANGRKAGTR